MPQGKLSRRQFLKRMLVGSAAVLAASYPFLIERYIILVNHYTIPVPNLPVGFDGFTIVHLSDLHYGLLVPETLIQWVVKKANALQKNMIVCTGDYVHERENTAQIDTVWPVLSELKADSGVYSVLGNHDHWADPQRSIEWMNKAGQNLRHQAVAIERGADRLWVGGAGDLWEDDVGVGKAFAQTPEKDCRILLAHNPDTADLSHPTRIDLMLSGHTHGGQVVIPLLGAPVLPVNNPRYTRGFIQLDNMNLFISSGIGWARAPVRFNCYPEIAVLHLQAAL